MSDNRELSAKIAEEVMGWNPITHFRGEPIADGWVGFWDGEWFRWTTRPESDEPDASVEWSPFTNMQDAWLVVMHFKDMQYGVSLEGEDGFDWSRWDFRIWNPADDPDIACPMAHGWDESLDLKERVASACVAICLAALETLKDER